MPIGRSTPTLKIAWYWNQTAKRWRVEVVLQQNGTSVPRTMQVETTEPLELWHARRLMTAIRTEMESWLPFEG